MKLSLKVLSPQISPGQSFDQHLAVSHGVLLAVGGDHSADVARRAFTGEIRALHHDPRHLQHMRDCRRAQRSLPIAADAHHGSLGKPV